MSLCVVLDTNIWLAHPMLRSPLGAALLHAIICANGRVGLPEVVEEELLRNVVAQGSRCINDIQTKLDKLRVLAGSAPDVLLPDLSTVRERVEHRLHELRNVLHRVPFTFEQAKRALQRVLDGTPPNGPKNQQFKDSLIWEASIDLARDYEVHLVSSDKGFFRNRQLCRELADDLERECQQIGVTITIYSGLRDLLEAIRPAVPKFDELPFLDALRDWAFDFGETYAGQKTFEVVSIGDPECRFFLTDDADTIAAAFGIRLELADWSPDVARTDASLEISGEAMCSLSEKRCTDVSPRVAEFGWTNPDGTQQGPSIVFSSVQGETGFRDRPYRLREPLE